MLPNYIQETAINTNTKSKLIKTREERNRNKEYDQFSSKSHQGALQRKKLNKSVTIRQTWMIKEFKY